MSNKFFFKYKATVILTRSQEFPELLIIYFVNIFKQGFLSKVFIGSWQHYWMLLAGEGD